ncbi:hypothetical protein N752_12330 [Desulforamulus aquiferis]|nr:MFS transporter [Desulforamulus aquiferis]RYD04711.1 hypothetical protein N752_12330 [Desulforamulus aquiferis]
MISSRGVLETFVWFAAIFTTVCIIGAQFIKNPPPGYKPAGWTPPVSTGGTLTKQNFTTREMVYTPQFYMVCITLMLATAAGLMVIPFAKVLGIQGGLSDAAATSGVMVIALFNSFGRLFWGAMSDKLGRKTTIICLLIIAGLCMLFLAKAQGYSVLVLIAIIAFAYGGYLGVFPAITADFWGLRNMGMNYGIILLGFGVAAVVSPYVAGYIHDTTNGFETSFLITAIASFIGAVLFFFLKPPGYKSTRIDTGISK